MLALKAQKRNADISLQELKKSGKIPAVFYGAGKSSTSISIPLIDFKKIWQKAGESSTVKLTMTDGEVDTLIHEVQTNPVTDEPIHVDFLAIDITKKIEVGIPIEFEGISGVVKSGLGTLVKVLHEVEVEALPKDLPNKLVVDISVLQTIEDQILAKDIKLPVGVVMITSADEVVASIAVQKEEVEEIAPVDLTSIEVEKKGKKEEEEIASGESKETSDSTKQ
jgi:large subunit ribosomal protein L25